MADNEDRERIQRGQPALLPPGDLDALVAHYERQFGETHIVFWNPDPFPVSVGVYAFPASPTRPYITLATTGMSAAPLNTAGADVGGWDRAELMMYLPPQWDFKAAHGGVPSSVLQLACRFPHLMGDWIGEGHTVAMEGSAPFFPESFLTALLLRAPIYEEPDLYHLWLPREAGSTSTGSFQSRPTSVTWLGHKEQRGSSTH